MRYLRRSRDATLFLTLTVVSLLALGAAWTGTRYMHQHLLEKDVLTTAVQWTQFIEHNLDDADRTLADGTLSPGDLRVLEFATEFGGVFRYKLFDSDGRIVAATRSEDLGQLNTRDYFRDIVQKGGTFIKTVRDDETATSRPVVSEAYAPIMRDGRFQGAIEVYADVAERAAELDRLMRYALAGLVALLLAIAALFGAATLQNIRRRERDLRAVAAARDRAEEAEAELRSVQEELLRKERLAALGQLTATVSHELRNPLGVIRNTMFTVGEAVRRHGLGLDRPLARIERSIVRCDDIIRELLDYTRMRELAPTAVAVDRWLAELLDEQQLPPGIQLERRLGAGDLVAEIDPERLRRAVVNLVENAAQAISEERPEAGGRVTVASCATAEHVEITVADTGPGIPDTVLPRIFEPLFSTKGFGVGLGLPTVKQIVEQHGGGIRVESEPGCGAAVTIWTPLRRSSALAA